MIIKRNSYWLTLDGHKFMLNGHYLRGHFLNLMYVCIFLPVNDLNEFLRGLSCVSSLRFYLLSYWVETESLAFL